MKLRFTNVFDLFIQENKFYLINQKLDTIIAISKSLYEVLNEIKLEKDKNVSDIKIQSDTLGILLYNRVLEVRN